MTQSNRRYAGPSQFQYQNFINKFNTSDDDYWNNGWRVAPLKPYVSGQSTLDRLRAKATSESYTLYLKLVKCRASPLQVKTVLLGNMHQNFHINIIADTVQNWSEILYKGGLYDHFLTGFLRSFFVLSELSDEQCAQKRKEHNIDFLNKNPVESLNSHITRLVWSTLQFC